jgi:two-component system response regulator FlrC
MRTVIHPQQGLWLDAEQGLTAQHQAVLAQAGLHAQAVQQLQDIDTVQAGQWLALRVDSLADLAQLAQWQQRSGLDLPVICRTPRHQMDLVVAAMKAGAAHVLAQDEISVGAWREAFQPSAQAATPSASPVAAPKRSAVYVDPQSRHLLALAQRVGQAGVTALIEGPTGAGKEVLARVLHESSARSRGPFVALNCATLPEQLIDDMLFGHEKGAFTGAQGAHRGLFEQAQGGSIFLDEIGEMPLHLQAKLLRVLQERQLTRLGSERRIDLDVRVIAATNKDLRQAIAQREFREDLYFRISTFKLRIAPLCERPGDILPLAACLLQRLAPAGQTPIGMHPDAQALLLAYGWPGNVRELENVMQRAVVLCTGSQIRAEHLMFDAPLEATCAAAAAPAAPSGSAAPATPAPHTAAAPAPVQAPHAHAHDWASVLHSPAPAPIVNNAQPQAERLHDAVRHNEHQLILAAIEATNSRIEAARKLGISPRTLRYKLAKLKGQPMAMTGT